MIKKIFVLLFVFFITGCSIQYDLEIKDKKILEKTTVSDLSDESHNILNKNFNLSFYKDSINITDTTSEEEIKRLEKYNKKIQDNNIEYSYNFSNNNYYNSNLANTCYDYFKVTQNKDIVTISTSNSFNCFKYYQDLEKVTINITSYYGIVQSNADKVNGKKHTWEITPNNSENKPIIFVYDSSKKNITLFDYIRENYILFLILCIFVIVVPIVLIIKFRNKKINKI